MDLDLLQALEHLIRRVALGDDAAGAAERMREP
jgi:hypothetical protein